MSFAFECCVGTTIGDEVDVRDIEVSQITLLSPVVD